MNDLRSTHHRCEHADLFRSGGDGQIPPEPTAPSSPPKQYHRCGFAFRLGLLLAFGLLTACGLDFNERPRLSESGSRGSYPETTSIHIAAAFGPDGTLWRVAAGRRHVYVDRSTDSGRTFSTPVAVNREPQRIKVDSENRPDIAVDRRGRIYVSFTAEGPRPTTLYASVSADGGSHFSAPLPASDKASEANSFQGRLRLAPNGHAYLFWHDERHRASDQEAGNALYFAALDGDTGAALPARKVADTQCECCRLAIDFDAEGRPVALARFIYPGDIRDHGLIQASADGERWLSRRVTFDDWELAGCPEHGPALAIDRNGHYHIAWFTLGPHRQGLFYAKSPDRAEHFGDPMPLGSPARQAGHPDIAVLGTRVFLAWREFAGGHTQILLMRSMDGGSTWTKPEVIAQTAAKADNPFLLSDGREVFLSWNSLDEGYRLIPIE